MDTIQTERVILRGFMREDLNDLYEYAKQTNVGPNAGWIPHCGLLESSIKLSEFINGNEAWAIEYKKHKKVIGSISLHQDNYRIRVNSRSLGYVLSEKYWGMGIMTECAGAVIKYAFDVVGVDILGVAHKPGNTRSQSVIKKCGFTYEGTIRHGVTLYNGIVEDRVLYSITRDEYKNIYG